MPTNYCAREDTRLEISSVFLLDFNAGPQVLHFDQPKRVRAITIQPQPKNSETCWDPFYSLVPIPLDGPDKPSSPLFCRHDGPISLLPSSQPSSWIDSDLITMVRVADYDLASNTFAWCQQGTPTTLRLTPHFLHITFYQLPCSWNGLHLLMNSESLPPDTSFVDKLSGRTFQFHSFVLDNWESAFDKSHLESIWSSSTLPVDVLDLLMATVYGDTSIWNCLESIDLSQGCSEGDLATIRNMTLLLQLLETSNADSLVGDLCAPLREVFNRMQVDSICSLLLHVWPYCFGSELISNMLAEVLRLDVGRLQARVGALHSVAQGEESFSAFFKLVSLAHGNSTLAFPRPHIGPTKLQERIIQLGIELEWHESGLEVEDAESLKSSHQFAFCIDSKVGYVLANVYVCYSEWPWFKALMDSGLEESRTHRACLPEYVTPGALVFLLRTLHGLRTESASTLKLEDQTALLACSEELGLTDKEEWKAGLGICDRAFLRELKPDSCLETLEYWWNMKQPTLVDHVINHACDHWNEVPSQSRSRLKLPPELLSLLVEKLTGEPAQ